MEDHPVPERLVRLIVAEIKSRVAEFGPDAVEGNLKALDMLNRLPRIHPDTELSINWSRQFPPAASAGLKLSAAQLELTTGDEESSGQLVYRCDARCYPEVDRDDLEEWISEPWRTRTWKSRSTIRSTECNVVS